MNIIKTKKEVLLNSLQPIINVVEKRNALPILMNVLIEKKNDDLIFTTSDIELEMSTRFKYFDSEEFKITVSARKFIEIIRSLSDDVNITLKKEKNKLLINQQKSKFSLQTLDSSDFPLININDEKKASLNISQQILKTLFDSTSFSMATQDVRYYLNGMYVQVKGSEIITVTTDGHRLAFNKMQLKEQDVSFQNEEGSFSCIVPRKAVMEIQKNIQEKEEKIEIDFYPNHLELRTEEKKLITKLIEGNFPDYTRVIPEESKVILNLEREDLLNKLHRISILTTDKHRGIKVKLTKEKLILKSTNTEQEEAEEEIICQSNVEIDIGFNVSYLIDVLTNIKTEKINFLLTDAQSSAVIQTTASKEFRYVVMPMRI
mgnify:CR=1 FL=1